MVSVSNLGMRAVGALAALIALPVAASAAPAQLRFKIEPGAGSPWNKSPGTKYEKRGECVLSSGPAVATWPVPANQILAKGQATAPMFNPGMPLPGGGYKPNSSDDGFNTLFYELATAGPDAKSMICFGTLLADGKDVTSDNARGSQRVVAKSVADVNASGPPMVSLHLDEKKLAAVWSPPAVTAHLDQNCNLLDIESGKVWCGSSGIDPKTMFGASPADLHYSDYPAQFAAVNGAKLSKVSNQAPGAFGCTKAQFSETHALVAKDSYFCIKTASGKIAEIKVTSVNQDSPKHANIYIQWTFAALP